MSQRLETARAGSNDEQTATREDKRGKDGTLPNTQEERSPLSRFARKTQPHTPWHLFLLAVLVIREARGDKQMTYHLLSHYTSPVNWEDSPPSC